MANIVLTCSGRLYSILMASRGLCELSSILYARSVAFSFSCSLAMFMLLLMPPARVYMCVVCMAEPQVARCTCRGIMAGPGSLTQVRATRTGPVSRLRPTVCQALRWWQEAMPSNTG